MIELRFESRLAAAADAVWRQASSMQGVNAELGPWLRMTFPAHRADLPAQPAAPGTVLFRSWILLGGCLPLDRHALSLERLHERGFDERSTSWMQRLWIHRRRVESDGDGARVTDQLLFEPRIAWLAPLLRMAVAAIFAHRHRQLIHRYGLLRA